jgi:(2Fe-2S) ferredoxin
VSAAAPLCADGARARQDNLVGTAAPARRWLLLEHPGPWAVDALGGSGIAADVQNRLRRAAAGAGARILLVRRPGRQHARPMRRWAVVDADVDADVDGDAGPRTPAVRWGSWASDADLLSCVDALAGGRGGRGGSGADAPTAEPLLLVCAHGRHDTCCAVRGRPVAACLAERWPVSTWECSHVGGDRFAANLLVLPGGACYGNLDPGNVVEVVQAHLEGRVSVDHLRGISTQPPVGQAAVAAVLRRFGPAGLSQVTVRSVRREGGESWSVLLAGSGPLPRAVEATVVRSRTAPARLTCRASGPTSAYRYDVADLRVTGAP